MDHQDFKQRAKKWPDLFKNEAIRAYLIGKKLFWASRTNSDLHETYEALGVHFYQLIKDQQLAYRDEKVEEMVAKIEEHIKTLEIYEEELKDIKEKSYSQEK